MRLVRHLHGSQATSMPLKTNSLANALARKPKQRLKSTKRLISIAQKPTIHASQGVMAQKPQKPHLHGSQPTDAPLPRKDSHSHTNLYRYSQLFEHTVFSRCTQVFSVILAQGGVLVIPVCIHLCLTKPKAFTEILPMPHRFQSPKLFPCPPLSRSLLFPVPVSFAFPSLSRFLALSDLLYFVPVRGRAA
jgi:hypothetical protein